MRERPPCHKGSPRDRFGPGEWHPRWLSTSRCRSGATREEDTPAPGRRSRHPARGPAMLLDAQPDMVVVDEAADGEEAVPTGADQPPRSGHRRPHMPGLSGVQTLERLRRELPAMRPLLVLTMHDDPAYARVALAAGAAGHVVKDSDSAELLAAIRAVHRGRTFVQVGSEGIEGLTASDLALRLPALSPRERQVLELLARVHTNRDVADRLALSVKTWRRPGRGSAKARGSTAGPTSTSRLAARPARSLIPPPGKWGGLGFPDGKTRRPRGHASRSNRVPIENRARDIAPRLAKTKEPSAAGRESRSPSPWSRQRAEPGVIRSCSHPPTTAWSRRPRLTVPS